MVLSRDNVIGVSLVRSVLGSGSGGIMGEMGVPDDKDHITYMTPQGRSGLDQHEQPRSA